MMACTFDSMAMMGMPVHYLPEPRRAAEWLHILLDDCPWAWLRKHAKDEEPQAYFAKGLGLFMPKSLLPRLERALEQANAP